MAVTLEFYQSSFAKIVCQNKATADDIIEAFEEVRGLHQSAHGQEQLRILIEDKGSSFAPSAAMVRSLSNIWKRLFAGTPIRIAVNVNTDLHFGIGRMFEVTLEEDSFKFFVSRNADEAKAWLFSEDSETG